ncbi:leucyl/phenylalanyl-tRNA--protein transferase [Parasutterella muris]|uniref:Leucyl/phenylalanyl-tRNA--protein transferase n=2 Tax=Parasutterella TaxID=577310 RepID=A0A6L6YIF6_9BURK|nr:leucyl/phenylalanyl-tRNA--protein transferase [Parasutterella muris]MVX57456.1 leucyl/phenylalanyl-tRNA--protein transferase [Parasutterella muris]
MSEIKFISGADSFKVLNPLNPIYKQRYEGIVAFSDTLRAEMLRAGYAKGVFPWSVSAPYLWFFTDPRLVLDPSQLIISHSLRKRIRDALQNVYRRDGIKHKLEIFLDHAPEDVLSGCAAARPGQDGTWISRPLRRAYLESMKDGFFHTIECRVDGKLAAGLIFDSIGRMLYGESMFTTLPDLSKLALSTLCSIARSESVHMIDCQEATEHLISLGGTELSGSDFYQSLQKETARDPIDWRLYCGRSLNDCLGILLSDK